MARLRGHNSILDTIHCPWVLQKVYHLPGTVRRILWGLSPWGNLTANGWFLVLLEIIVHEAEDK